MVNQVTSPGAIPKTPGPTSSPTNYEIWRAGGEIPSGPQPNFAEKIAGQLTDAVKKIPEKALDAGSKLKTGVEEYVTKNPLKTALGGSILALSLQEPEEPEKRKSNRGIGSVLRDPDDEDEKKRKRERDNWLWERPVWADRTTRFPSSYYGPGSEEIDYFPY